MLVTIAIGFAGIGILKTRIMGLLLDDTQDVDTEDGRDDGVERCRLSWTCLAFGGRLHGALCSCRGNDGQTKQSPGTGNNAARRPN